jgi:Ca2+-binding EF-hand superfamily protein
MLRTCATLGLFGVLVAAAGSATSDDPTGPKKPLLSQAPELIFKKMDADGDGKVSRAEFKEVMTHAGGGRLADKGELVDKIFTRADVDRDGFLTFEEFKGIKLSLREFLSFAPPILQQRPRLAARFFQQGDLDGDGYLSLDELQKLTTALRERFGKGP